MPGFFSGFYLTTVSPLNDPARFIFSLLFAVHFYNYSLKFLRFLKPGATINFNRRRPIRSLAFLQVRPGRPHITQDKTVPDIIRSYNSPQSTAFLGLLFYTAAVILIVLTFKRIDYIY